MKQAYVKIAVLACAAFLALGCQMKPPKGALALSPESLADRQLQTRIFHTSDEPTMLAASSAVLQDIGFNLNESNKPLGLLTVSKSREAVSGGQIAGAILLAAFTGVIVHVDQQQIIRASVVTRPVKHEQTEAENAVTKQRISNSTDHLCETLGSYIREDLKTAYGTSIPDADMEKMNHSLTETIQSNLNEMLQLKLLKGATAVRVTFQRMIFNTAGQVTKLEQINDPEIYQAFFDKLSQSVFLEANQI